MPTASPSTGATLKLELPGRGGTTSRPTRRASGRSAAIAAGRWNIDIERSRASLTKKTYTELLAGEFTRVPPMEVKLEKAVDSGPSAEVLGALKDARRRLRGRAFTEARALYEKALADPRSRPSPGQEGPPHAHRPVAVPGGAYEKELGAPPGGPRPGARPTPHDHDA